MPRFYQAPPWHLLVTDRQSATITLLDRLASDRAVRYELGAPAQFQGVVPSDSPEINILHDDNFTPNFPLFEPDYPFLETSSRFLYGLRKDVMSSDSSFQPRFAGIIFDISDEGDTERGLSRFLACDPWQLLMARPCMNLRVPFGGGEAFDLPIDHGTIFPAGTTLNYIATELLRRTIEAHGTVHIDAGDGTRIGEGAQYDDWSGTALYEGTIEECATLTAPMVFEKGTTVGEAWRQLMDTGGIDIILRPIYDLDRPGYLCEFNCYVPENFDYGQTSFQQISWDRSGRAVTAITRETDGRELANKIRVFGPMGAPRPTVTSSPSITRFGQYWAELQVARYASNMTLDGMADRELKRRQLGRRTWRVTLAPEWEIAPFRDLDLGYDVGLYHSNRLRSEQWLFHRVLGFSLALEDTSGEQVSDVLLSTDEEEVRSP